MKNIPTNDGYMPAKKRLDPTTLAAKLNKAKKNQPIQVSPLKQLQTQDQAITTFGSRYSLKRPSDKSIRSSDSNIVKDPKSKKPKIQFDDIPVAYRRRV